MVEGEEPVTERSAEILAKMAEVRGKVEAMPSLSGMLREALTPEDVQDYSVEARVDVVLALVRVELMRAMAKFAPFSSTHEGWAVIREEVDELWDEVKANSSARACEEAIQVAAMGVRFLVDLASDERMDTMIDSYQKKG